MGVTLQVSRNNFEMWGFYPSGDKPTASISENIEMSALNPMLKNTAIKINYANINSGRIIDYNGSTNYIKRQVIDCTIITTNYIERQVIDMDAEIQSKIDGIIKVYKNVHVILFVISAFIVMLSWAPWIMSEDVSIVLKPLSIAFSLMIIIHYYLRRLK